MRHNKKINQMLELKPKNKYLENEKILARIVANEQIK
jgi:hypothetical protein